MTPYDVLGVTPDTPLPEIEAAYRLLLREHHPDLHQARGPDAVAAAEARTRQLNLAIEAVRAAARGERPRWATRDWYRAEHWGATSSPTPDAGTTRTDHGRWWEPAPSTHAGPVDEPVPCPYCGQPFEHLADFQAHLLASHRIRQRSYWASREPTVLDRFATRLRVVPAWLAVLVAIAVVLVTPPVVWLVALAGLALLLWAQARPRTRGRPFSGPG